MNCIHCSQPINPGSRFCISCGREQVDRTHPRPPDPPPQPLPQQPAHQPYSGPLSPGGIPNIQVPSKSGSAKIIVALAAAFLLVLGIGGAVAYFYFFPPGVFVRDTFRKPHPQIEKDIQLFGNKARYVDNTLELLPPDKSFYAVIYDTVASDNSTIEGTIEWKEGEQDVLFGIICCAASVDNFHVFMIGGKNNYLVQGYASGTWYDLTGFLKLPKTKEIRKNVKYQLALKTEDDLVSAYLDDELLLQFVDATDHKGKVGIYAQGGANGPTAISFSSFSAKKNSMFQSD